MNKPILFCFIAICFNISKPSCFCQIDFEFSYLTDGEENCIGIYDFDLMDIDNDGDLDILSSSYCGGAISWYENIDGFGGFGESVIIDGIDFGSYTIQGVDFDGDNDIDIVAGLNKSNDIVWYENTNDEEFSTKRVIHENSKGIRKALVRDIDNDEDLDIIYIQDGDAGHCYILINENGAYEKVQLFNSEGISFDFIFEDVNNDGLNDIVVVGEDVFIIENKGNGEFQTEKNIFELFVGISVKAYDLDNDEDLDLVISSLQESVIVLENLGDMNFTFGELIHFGAGNYTDVIGMYINGDDFIDLCIPTVAGFHTVISSGQVTNLVKKSSFHESEGFTAYRMKVNDIDLDSKVDVVVCSIGKNRMGIYKNLSDLSSTVTSPEKQENVYIVGDQLFLPSNPEISKLRIFNSSGQLVLDPYYNEIIDISSLLDGIYFYQLIGVNSIYSGQFFVLN